MTTQAEKDQLRNTTIALRDALGVAALRSDELLAQIEALVVDDVPEPPPLPPPDGAESMSEQ